MPNHCNNQLTLDILGYIEEGMFFCGKYTASPTEDHDEFYNDIKAAPQELKDSLGYVPWEEEESLTND